MMEQLQQKKIIFILVGILLVLGILLVIFSQRGTSKPIPQEVSNIEMLKQSEQIIVPTLPPDRGEGLDLESMPVKVSEQEIEKLRSVLPYNEIFTSSTGQDIEIFIPSIDLLMDKWVLTVNIFGPEYEVGSDSQAYQINKTSFREAASKVSDFLITNNVNIDQVVIEWGDREYIRNKAAEWLSD